MGPKPHLWPRYLILLHAPAPRRRSSQTERTCERGSAESAQRPMIRRPKASWSHGSAPPTAGRGPAHSRMSPVPLSASPLGGSSVQRGQRSCAFKRPRPRFLPAARPRARFPAVYGSAPLPVKWE